MSENDLGDREPGPEAPTGRATYGAVGHALMRASEALALLGGIVLLLITTVTVLSVIGRAGLDMPVLGDSEVVEIGIAFSIFSFLAYCQMRGGNVIVDFFTARAPAGMRKGLDTASAILFTAVVGVLTWRLALGGLDSFHREDHSMFLQIPAWWGYLGAFVSCLVWGAACLHTAAWRLRGG